MQKRQKKAKKEKIEEAELWQRPKTVNGEFKKSNDAIKKTEKMSKTVLKKFVNKLLR